MSASENQYLQIGIVGKARGLRGEFFVSGRDEEWPGSVKRIYIGQPTGAGFKVRAVSDAGARIVLKLEGINSRDEIEAYRLQPIFCHRRDIALNESTEFLWQDLIGVKILDSTGYEIGIIDGFENYGAHDNVMISHGDKFIELPFIAEFFAMEFTGRPEAIQLLRSHDDLVGLWQERP